MSHQQSTLFLPFCGLDNGVNFRARRVGEALRWLLAQGVLRQVGTHRRTALFELGAGPPAGGAAGAVTSRLVPHHA